MGREYCQAMRRSVSKCVSLLFARGDTTVPSGLYAGLCNAFLVVDRVAGKIICLVPSVCVCMCVSVCCGHSLFEPFDLWP